MPTIITVSETWDESAGWKDSGEPGSGNATSKRSFDVTCTDDARPQDVLVDVRIPRKGSVHPWNNAFTCIGSNAKRSGPITYKVESDYEAKVSLSDPDNPTQNPLLEPAKRRCRTIKSDEPIDEDVNGTPIATVNNEPIIGITRKFSDLAVHITKNIALFDPNLVDLYADTVNSSPFLGFPAGKLRLDEIDAEEIVSDEYTYWRASVLLVSRRVIRQSTVERAWWKRVRHEGFLEKTLAPANAIINAVDENGEKVSRPVLLDENGRRITNAANAHFLEWQVYETSEFNNLIVL